MIINNIVSIGFKIPDEYKEMKLFVEQNGLQDWKEDYSSQYIYYTKKSTFVTDKINTATLKKEV